MNQLPSKLEFEPETQLKTKKVITVIAKAVAVKTFFGL